MNQKTIKETIALPFVKISEILNPCPIHRHFEDVLAARAMRGLLDSGHPELAVCVVDCDAGRLAELMRGKPEKALNAMLQLCEADRRGNIIPIAPVELESLFNTEEDPHIRAAAVLLDANDLAEMTCMDGDASPIVRAAGIKGLLKKNLRECSSSAADAYTVEVLTKAMKDEAPEVRIAVMECMDPLNGYAPESFGRPAIIQLLGDGREDADMRVRAAALVAYAQLVDLHHELVHEAFLPKRECDMGEDAHYIARVDGCDHCVVEVTIPSMSNVLTEDGGKTIMVDAFTVVGAYRLADNEPVPPEPLQYPKVRGISMADLGVREAHRFAWLYAKP